MLITILTHAGRCRLFSARVLVLLTLSILMASLGSAAWAGGGPENLLLVINANSQNSMEVGNQYARLKNLPVPNVLHLDYQGSLESVSGEVFRDQILLPILSAINSRGLGRQIDMVAYSCDFPWRVDFRKGFPKKLKLPKTRNPIASLTGATYLWQMILAKQGDFTSMNANWYVPGMTGKNLTKCTELGDVSTRAFRGRYAWQPTGERVAASDQRGRRYLLSTMLGVTTGRGNSVDEILDNLRRSSYANVVTPEGAFYFVHNNDVRSSTRHAGYDEVAEQLRAMGAEAYVTKGKLPKGEGPILGMMLGTARLPLKKAKLTIQPGAICEHLTSYGGVLFSKSGQTPFCSLWTIASLRA